MAMSVTYVTVHGRLREETRGGVTTRYLGDTLGSVIKTTDTSGNVTSTTTYWPFGEVRSQTGTNPSPWGFCGVWGYLTDAASRMYVRARHYRADTSRWLSVDPLWPDESAYGYADNAPIDNFDPEGTWVIPVACASACLVTAGCAAGVWIACGSLWGTSDFDDCAKDYIESLPPISKIGCGVGLLGCLAERTSPAGSPHANSCTTKRACAGAKTSRTHSKANTQGPVWTSGQPRISKGEMVSKLHGRIYGLLEST
jgi:RHS repeat-associated protein